MVELSTQSQYNCFQVNECHIPCLKDECYKEPSWADGRIPLSTFPCVLWVNPRVSPSVCVQLSEWWREGRVLSRPLSCFVQCSASPTYKGKVRWRTPSRDASFACGESKLRRHFLSARATWLAREVQAACLQLLALWKNLREEDFSNGSSIGELDGGVSLH